VRILLASFIVILAAIATQKIIVLLVPFQGRTVPRIATLISIVVVYGAYRTYVRLVEKRAVAEFSSGGALKELGAGVLIGILLFSSAIAVLWAIGAYKVTAVGAVSSMVGPLIGAMMAGVAEEIVFRGIVFRIVEQSLGTWLAMLISAVLFGFIHLISPHATLLGAISIIFEAGILLAAAFIATRRLWLPIGLHTAWNFVQGGVFGVAVSGTPAKGLLQGTLSGPEWLSGGAFGAEASVVAIAICLVAALGLIAWAMRRNQIVQPFWRATPPINTSA
jgi:membrane protease YdiL (CAAX protease family)